MHLVQINANLDKHFSDQFCLYQVVGNPYMSASNATTIDDVSEDEDEEPQLAINMDAVNTSITTP
jgi:hypothetical protein